MNKASLVQKALMVVGLGMLLTSCGSYGPRSMDRDQLNYGNSIGENWKNQMLDALAGFIDVPAEKATYAAPGYDVSGTSRRPFQVLSGKDRPEQSFVQAKYQGYWYWIDNSDIASKRVFTLMLFITTLTNQANAPVLTIPTQ